MSEHNNLVDEEAAAVAQPLQASSQPAAEERCVGWRTHALRVIAVSAGIAVVTVGVFIAGGGKLGSEQPIATPAHSLLNSAMDLYGQHSYFGYNQGRHQDLGNRQYDDPTASYGSYSDERGGSQDYSNNRVVVVHHTHHNVYHGSDVRRFAAGETAYIKGEYGGFWPVRVLAYSGDQTYHVRYQNSHRDGRTVLVNQAYLKHYNPYLFSPKVWSGIAACVLCILSLLLCASCANQKQ